MGLAAVGVGATSIAGGALAYHQIKSRGGFAATRAEMQRYMARRGLQFDEAGQVRIPTWGPFDDPNPQSFADVPGSKRQAAHRLPPGQTFDTQQAQTGGLDALRAGPPIDARPSGTSVRKTPFAFLEWTNSPPDWEALGDIFLLTETKAKPGNRPKSRRERDAAARAYMEIVAQASIAEIDQHRQGAMAYANQDEALRRVAAWSMGQMDALVGLGVFADDVTRDWETLRNTPEKLSPERGMDLARLQVDISHDLQQNSSPTADLPFGLNLLAIRREDGGLRYVLDYDVDHLMAPADTTRPGTFDEDGLPIGSDEESVEVGRAKRAVRTLRHLNPSWIMEKAQENIRTMNAYGISELAKAHGGEDSPGFKAALDRMDNWYHYVHYWLKTPADELDLSTPLPGYDGFDFWPDEKVKLDDDGNRVSKRPDTRKQLAEWRKAHPDVPAETIMAVA